jgi:ribosome-associated toxin RatA of RatAB toxin-antitoxin module
VKKLFTVLCLLSTVLGYASGPGSSAGVKSGANYKKLHNKPETIISRVGDLKEGDAVWISMEVDVHMVSDIPLYKLKAAITDYTKYPEFFKRSTDSYIVEENDEGTIASFEVTVGALGITVASTYEVLLKVLIDEPGKFLVEFTHYSDDGTVRNVRGYWYFESVELGNKTCTYLRNYTAVESLEVNMLQKTAATLFIGSEYMSMLRELQKAAKSKP